MTTLLERQREYAGWLEKGFPDLDLKGLSLVGSCAITGNGSEENQCKPVTEGPKDHGSDGVLQWRLDRLDGPRGLKGWSEALGLDWTTLKTQAAFTLWELYNDPRYATLVKDLRDGKKKIETLTANFCWIYERPNKALAHLDLRVQHAKSVFLILSKERRVPVPTKIGASVATAAGGAATANMADGGDLFWTIAGGIVAIAAAIAGPIVSQWGKSQPEVEEAEAPPVAEQIDHIDAFEDRHADPADALNAAIAHRKACEEALSAAISYEAQERGKLLDRLDALRAALAIPEYAAPEQPAAGEEIAAVQT